MSWVTSTLFSAPAQVKLAVTPSSGLACTLSTLASALHKEPDRRPPVGVPWRVRGLTILFVLELLRRARPNNAARYAGLALIALVFGGPAAWPWYLVWGLALLAATPTAARSPGRR